MRVVQLVLLLIALFGLSCVAANNYPRSSLRVLFDRKMDLDVKDSLITPAELARFIYLMDPDEKGVPSLEAVKPIFEPLDLNRDGVLDWTEFSKVFHSLDVDNASPLPQQIHLALTNEPSSMALMWSSPDTVSTPTVQLGTTPPPQGSFSTFTGTSSSYSVANGLYTSLSIHTVYLTGLQPATLYYYRCGSNNTWSDVLNFTSPPALSERSSTWAVFGDMGTTVPFGYAITNEMVAENMVNPFDLALHVGDLAYAGVTNSKNGEWEPTWDVWMNQIQPLASLLPYQVTVGNHENYYNYTAFMNRFDMPGTSTDGNGNFWFSFDYGTAHVTSMSTEHDYSTGSPQYEWIEKDLADARARGVEWLFVSGHRPYYSSDQDEYGSHSPGAPLLTYLEPLLIKYQVDMVLTGHMHCYERTYPVFNGTINVAPGSNVYEKPSAPVYIVQGTAGAMIFETWVTPQPVWSAVRDQQYGFGVMTLAPSTNSSFTSSLHYQFMAGQKVLDEFWIYK